MVYWKGVRKVAKYSAIGGVCGVGVCCATWDAFYRGTVFWLHMGPLLAHYKYVEFSMEEGKAKTEKFEELHIRWAPVTLRCAMLLKGLYVKFGQYTASRPDTIPRPFVEQLRSLQDGIPPENFEYIKNVVESELNLENLEDLFCEFHKEPLGAASIGQAHYAKLHTGEEVVVKVQYPEIERVFRSDLWIIQQFLTLAIPDMAAVFDEVKHQFSSEFDYELEAKNLKEIGDAILPKWKHLVDVPKPFEKFCTKHVLTMSYIPGEKLEDALMKAYGPNFKDNMRKKFKANNFRIPSEFEFQLLRAYNYVHNSSHSILYYFVNYSIGIVARILGYEQMLISKPKPQLPNPGELLNVLLDVHAYETFQVGKVNGDPHPGNILLTPDGRLGLIDYGQVKRLTLAQRLRFAKLIVAMSENDEEETAKNFWSMGFNSVNNDPYLAYKYATLMFDRFDSEVCDGKEAHEFFSELRKRDKVKKYAGSYYLLSRVSAMMRGLGFLLGYNVSIARKWKSRAQELIDQHQMAT